MGIFGFDRYLQAGNVGESITSADNYVSTDGLLSIGFCRGYPYPFESS